MLSLAHLVSRRTHKLAFTCIEETAMPMNRIQFQPGVSLAEFFARYGTEVQCAAALT